MSRIDELIAELCPDGVEYKELKSIARRTRGASVSAAQMKAFHVDGAAVTVFAAGNTSATVPEGTFEELSVTREPAVMVKARGNIGLVYCDTPFTHKTELWAYAFGENDTTARFVLHFLRTQVPRLQGLAHARGGKLPQLSVGDTDDLLVPVPPLAVQQEIVRILDKMEQLEAELEAELEARRKQYEHYRDSLLNFSEAPPEWQVRWTTLGDVAAIASERSAAIRLDASNYVGVDNLVPNFGGRTDSAFSPNSSGAIRFGHGDILIGNIRPYLKKVWLADRDGGASPDVLTITLNDDGLSAVLPKYLYLIIASENFIHYVMQSARGAKMPRGDKKAILRFQLPLPPLAEQERIADELYKFDAMVNDLSSGLPAEIAARRKQYEYYRDKLLTFPELKADAA